MRDDAAGRAPCAVHAAAHAAGAAAPVMDARLSAHRAAAAGAAAPELLDMLRSELRNEYEHRLRTDLSTACEQIDWLVESALRQLPPHLRNMPARQAFALPGSALPGGVLQAIAALSSGAGARGAALPSRAGGGGECGAAAKKKRQDAQTQTAAASAQSKRLKPQKEAGASQPRSSGPLAAPRLSAMSVDTTDPEGMARYVEEVARRKQELDEFQRILTQDAPGRLEALPPDQRSSFLGRVNETYEGFGRLLPMGVGGGSPGLANGGA